MHRTSFRRDKQDNQNNKRWSTSVIEQGNHQESILSQSTDSILLTNQLGIPKDKAFVLKQRISLYLNILFLENGHVSQQDFVQHNLRSIGKYQDEIYSSNNACF